MKRPTAIAHIRRPSSRIIGVRWRRRTYSQEIKFIITSLLLLVVTSIGTAHGEISLNEENNAPRSLVPKLFYFGVLETLSGVNMTDARVAIEMNWARMFKDNFPESTFRLEVLSDVNSAAKFMQEGKLHALTLNGMDYLSLEKLHPIVPLLSSSRQTAPLESYLLVTGKDNDFDSLAKQSRRSLLVDNDSIGNFDRMWLDVILNDHGLPRSEEFFTSITFKEKPSRAVLPVFFGQADACLVPESVFRTMVELNPQLGQKLVVLKKSPAIVRSIVCTVRNLHPDVRAFILSEALSFDDTVDGQQLLTIFQVKKVVPFTTELLAPMKELINKYNQLSEPKL